MYKCSNNECRFKIEDSTVHFVSTEPGYGIVDTIRKKRCPVCKSELLFINEIFEMSEKYKKSMNINTENIYDTKK